jgi:hypothetical protein
VRSIETCRWVATIELLLPSVSPGRSYWIRIAVRGMIGTCRASAVLRGGDIDNRYRNRYSELCQLFKMRWFTFKTISWYCRNHPTSFTCPLKSSRIISLKDKFKLSGRLATKFLCLLYLISVPEQQF